MNVQQYFRVPKINIPAIPYFEPTDISGLSAWYDASDLSTITKDGSDFVSQINDKSGNLRHAGQATTGNRPVYNASGLNGYPTLVFDGIDDFLEASFTLPGYPLTVFLVTQDGGYPFSYWQGSSRYYTAFWTAGKPRSQNRGATSVANQLINNKNSPGIFVSQLTDLNIRTLAITGGAEENIEDVNTSHAVVWYNSTKVFLGQLRAGGPFHTGNISEVVFYNSELTNSEIIGVFNYLSQKYGDLPFPTSL